MATQPSTGVVAVAVASATTRSLGQGPAHGQGGLAADAGVDLVEDQGGRGFAQHQPAGEHGPGQLPAGCHLGQGQGRLARVGAEEEGDGGAGGVVVGHGHLEAGPGQGQLSQVALDRSRQPGRRLPAGPAHGRGRLFDGGQGHDPLLLQLRHPLVVRVELGQPASSVGPVLQDVGQPLTVLATQLPEQSPPAPDLVEALGVLGDGVGRPAGVGRGLVQLGRHRPQAGLDVGERGAPGEGLEGEGDGVGRAPVVAQRGVGGDPRLAVGGGPGQEVLLRLQGVLLPRVGEAGGVELAHLEGEEVDLPGPGPGVAPQRDQGGVEGRDLLLGRGQGGEVDGAEAVEGSPLHPSPEERLVVVLAVEIHHPPADLGQFGDGGQPPVDVGPRPSRAGDGPGQDDLVVTGHEAALDPGLVGAGTDQDGVGPAAHQQLDGLHHQRLAGAGLAGEGGHPRLEDEGEVGDHPQVANVQLDQHQRSDTASLARRTP